MDLKNRLIIERGSLLYIWITVVYLDELCTFVPDIT